MRVQDLPVVVDLPGRLGEEVSAFVEVEAGWQVVGQEGGLVPALELTSAPRAGRPCVVVKEGAVSADDVRGALLGGALDVIAWPQDRARLLEAPLRTRTTDPETGGPAVLRVAGCSGGVGTSTVVLALGGLFAWAGKQTLVIGDDDLLPLCGLDPRRDRSERGESGEPAALARPLPGIDRLAVLGGGGLLGRSMTGWPVDTVVVDLGAPRRLAGADLVCSRPDARLAALANAPGDVPVLIIGDGPLEPAAVRRRLGRPPVAWLPRSARVARAGLLGTVPTGLPGTWLNMLRTGLRRMSR